MSVESKTGTDAHEFALHGVVVVPHVVFAARMSGGVDVLWNVPLLEI